MLLIAAPHRRRNDVGVSLRAPAGDPAVAASVAEEARGAGCPPKTAERVRQAIFHSGRYDCRVAQAAVAFRNHQYLKRAFAKLGGAFIITDDPLRESELTCGS